MAVTAKTAWGEARKPGGASRRHAQAISKLRAMHAAHSKLTPLPRIARMTLPGQIPGCINAAA
jgi:hypothetical protein